MKCISLSFALLLLLLGTSSAAPDGARPQSRFEKTQVLAEAGDRDAQWELAEMYKFGVVVAADDKLAVEWTRKAARQGQMDAQVEMGLRFEAGAGMEASATRAANWFRKAGEQGHLEAQLKLGRYYVDGKGVKRSDRIAMEWFRRAAEQGDLRSQRLLAAAYFEGRGLPRDIMESRMWLEISGAADRPNGRKLREQLNERMSEDQVARARARAEEWRAAHGEPQKEELQSSR